MAYSVNDNSSINNLVEKLKYRLKNFAIVAPNGEQLGEVEDFILDSNRQLKLVVRVNNNPESQSFLLLSKLIQKIEPANKTVLVNLNQAEFEKLPKYAKPDITTDNTINPISSASESVSESINYSSDISLGENIPTTPLFEQDMQNEVRSNINLDSSNDVHEAVSLGEEIIRLLGERVVVARSKRKVGEVIVRKEIETRMVQVPVRYEKLIIEQVGSEPKQLAEIILGEASANIDDQPETVVRANKSISQDDINRVALTQDTTTSLNGELRVSGKFDSPKTASLLLNAIAMERNQGCKQVRVEIVVENEERKKTYQEWFNRCSIGS
jgi:hypothetical protein